MPQGERQLQRQEGGPPKGPTLHSPGSQPPILKYHLMFWGPRAEVRSRDGRAKDDSHWLHTQATTEEDRWAELGAATIGAALLDWPKELVLG